MPDPTAKDPHTLTIDHQSGILWFTVQQANMIGRLDPKTGEVKLVTAPTPKSRPYGILINSKGVPVFCAFGTNKLATIDPKTMAIKEYALPNAGSRPRRIALTDDDAIWYADFSRGYLGRFDPDDRQGQGVAVAERAEVGSPTASSSPRARSGTTSRSPSRTRSCASIRRPRNSRPGRFRAAATSCATWT